MIRVRFHEEAEDDFLDAIRYYADRSRTVASRFVQEVRSGIELISTHPEIGPRISHNARRKVLRNFPYSLIYADEGKELLVVGVARDNRRPGYWKKRASGA
jgi:plasmid stabilization system protein ParE